MALQLYDSLTRSLQPITASHPDGVVRFYTCGPTVYAAAHVGNFRTFLVNDLIRRLLDLQFGSAKVRHVRNITDVDDKTIKQAHEESRPLREITHRWAVKFQADCVALGCLLPHAEPAATDHIAEQVSMIEALLEKGHAYRVADGSVFFKVNSFADYGRLSRVKERKLKPGSARPASEVLNAGDSDEKESGTDFALWKAWKPADGKVKWPGPGDASEGRPGWHIECSAMSKHHLGDTIDLHAGGVDLLFPHHENEIAQSECCNGTTFSHRWYHSEHLLVDGKKMSKSLGNLYTLDQLQDMGHAPAAVRYALLAGHPRQQLNFTLDSLHAAAQALATLRKFRAQLGNQAGKVARFRPVLAALEDDLNTPLALGALFGLVNAGPPGVDAATFDRVIDVFGFDLAPPSKEPVTIPTAVIALAKKRWAAKQARDWSAADALRAEIAAAGWSIKDHPTGYNLEKAAD